MQTWCQLDVTICISAIKKCKYYIWEGLQMCKPASQKSTVIFLPLSELTYNTQISADTQASTHMFKTFFFPLCKRMCLYIIKDKSRDWKQQARCWSPVSRRGRNATPNQECRESSCKFRWMSLKPQSHVRSRFQSRQAQHQTWHYNLPLRGSSVTQKSLFDKYTVSSAKKCRALCVCLCGVWVYFFLEGDAFFFVFLER